MKHWIEKLYESLSYNGLKYQIDIDIISEKGIFNGGSCSAIESELNLIFSIAYTLWVNEKAGDIELYDLKHPNEKRAPDIIADGKAIECKRLRLIGNNGEKLDYNKNLVDMINKSINKSNILIIMYQSDIVQITNGKIPSEYEDIICVKIPETILNNSGISIKAHMFSWKTKSNISILLDIQYFTVREFLGNADYKNGVYTADESRIQNKYIKKNIFMTIGNKIRLNYMGYNEPREIRPMSGVSIETSNKIIGCGTKEFILMQATYMEHNEVRIKSGDVYKSDVNDTNIKTFILKLDR